MRAILPARGATATFVAKLWLLTRTFGFPPRLRGRRFGEAKRRRTGGGATSICDVVGTISVLLWGCDKQAPALAKLTRELDHSQALSAGKFDGVSRVPPVPSSAGKCIITWRLPLRLASLGTSPVNRGGKHSRKLQTVIGKHSWISLFQQRSPKIVRLQQADYNEQFGPGTFSHGLRSQLRT